MEQLNVFNIAIDYCCGRVVGLSEARAGPGQAGLLTTGHAGRLSENRAGPGFRMSARADL